MLTKLERDRIRQIVESYQTMPHDISMAMKTANAMLFADVAAGYLIRAIDDIETLEGENNGN